MVRRRSNIRRRRSNRRRGPVVSTCGWGVSEAEARQSAATVFRGELMTCALCGKQERSSLETNTDWRALEIDGRRNYVCPTHFPPDGSSSRAFAKAYADVLARLTDRQDILRWAASL